MEAFITIVNKIGDTSTNIFMSCRTINGKGFAYSSKFKLLENTFNNRFLDDKSKTNIMNIFSKSQKIYNVFSRLAYIYKIKKSTVKIEYDLYMNPIEMSNPNAILVYQERGLYMFTLSDLIRIVENAITNSPNFFSEPLEPKNPYNNVPFSLAVLYNLYYKIKSSSLLMPPTIHAYFMSGFNLVNFEMNNEDLIRKTAIHNYVTKGSTEILVSEVYDMLSTFIHNKIKIAEDFPEETLVEIMRPYLHLYCMYRYSPGSSSSLRNRLGSTLTHLLYDFQYEYPSFGRKILLREPDQQFKKRHIVRYKEGFNTENPNIKLVDIINNNYMYKSKHNIYEDNYSNRNRINIEQFRTSWIERIYRNGLERLNLSEEPVITPRVLGRSDDEIEEGEIRSSDGTIENDSDDESQINSQQYDNDRLLQEVFGEDTDTDTDTDSEEEANDTDSVS